MTKSIITTLALLCAVALINSQPFAASSVLPQKTSVDEIVSKHLDSIGTAAARSAANSRVIAGGTQVTFRSRGMAQASGGAVLASDGQMSMVTMKFESSQYPYEKIGFDGKKVSAYQLPGGDYSSLGGFARTSPEILKEGLIGGTMSSAWSLLDVAGRRAKLEFVGRKKVNSRELLVLGYVPRGGSDLSITLFFDPENFHHVRTVYQRTISSQMGRTPEQSPSLSATHYELVEEFDDFKTEGGLTLPHTYKIRLGQQGSGTQISEWAMTLVRFVYNQKLEAKDFDVTK
ncbi:MAG TPA: hypothetical protein VE863_11325 [Pyrinomonadaceae bacterium]|nr:hypothetical protein [Pyrinomonadaceae bacterium]